jgi:cyclopropane fatty-acyl-phospholipid synthase-like methyltransferase
MHFTEFFSIVERDLDILNPTSHEKLMLLADYCGLRDGSRVLDVGSGKGYMLRAWAGRSRIEGTGLEINPSFVARARECAGTEGVSDNLTFVEGDAKDFSPKPHSYDIVTCLGAPFAIGSFEEAVAWMLRALRPGGVLAIGDQFFRRSRLKNWSSGSTSTRQSTGPSPRRWLFSSPGRLA